MKNAWQDFLKFIKRGNVVDMAIGVAVASAFTAIVTAFTKGFITPLIGYITGGIDLSEMKYVLTPADEAAGVAENAILWGAFVQTVIDFLIIAAVFFTVLRIVSGLSARYAKIRETVVNRFTDSDEIAAAEAEQKRLEEEAAAALEAENARLKAEAETLAIAEEKARLERQEQLLTEIRDLLKNK